MKLASFLLVALSLCFTTGAILPRRAGVEGSGDQVILSFRIEDETVDTGQCPSPDGFVHQASFCTKWQITEGNWTALTGTGVWIERIEFILFTAQVDDVSDCTIYMDTGSTADLAIDESVAVTTMGNLAPTGDLEEIYDSHVYTHQAFVAARDFYRFRFVDRGVGVCEKVLGLSFNVIGRLKQ